MVDILKDQLIKESTASLEKELDEGRKARNKRKAVKRKAKKRAK